MNIRKFIALAMSNGGGSYCLFTGECNPTEGFMVSLKGHENSVEEITFENVQEYFSRNAHLLTMPDHYFGLWKNGDEWVMDVSVNETDLHRAIELGDANDQKALWDCANNVEVWIQKIKNVG